MGMGTAGGSGGAWGPWQCLETRSDALGDARELQGYLGTPGMLGDPMDMLGDAKGPW